MTTIHIATSTEYDVLIEGGILKDAGKYISNVKPSGKAVIISDSHVFPLYGKAVTDSLEKEGFPVLSFVFPAGEEQKNGATYFSILNFLAENQVTRSDFLIALGGGVVGDITGFAAATFLRGIPFVQIPTSLLAMVDSSVGGKTAIDLPAGKNLVGAFYQPILVLCDTDVLGTLPESIFADGCAEVIKYAVLFDPELFDHLICNGAAFDRNYVISRCVAWKRDVVQEDEFDRGVRQKLNLGHTIGHGIEAHSNFSVSHGQAVAIGMAIVTKAAVKAGICHRKVYDNLSAILDMFSLPSSTAFDADALYHCALSDKKRSGGNVNLILPHSIGNCVIHNIPTQELKSFIEAGLSSWT